MTLRKLGSGCSNSHSVLQRGLPAFFEWGTERKKEKEEKETMKKRKKEKED